MKAIGERHAREAIGHSSCIGDLGKHRPAYFDVDSSIAQIRSCMIDSAKIERGGDRFAGVQPSIPESSSS